MNLKAVRSLVLVLTLLLAAEAEAEAARRRNSKRTKAADEDGANDALPPAPVSAFRTGHYRQDHEANRSGKLFSLFTIVNFRNDGCQSTSSLTNGQAQFRNGTCYTTTECANRGGSGNGGCAAGFGVCCVFTATTSSTITENCTYLQNPSFPGTDTATTAGLTYTVQRCSNNVCALRLDFETFTIAGPGLTTELNGGQCNVDTFTVTTNTNQNVPTICGNNQGQHIYVDIGSTTGNTASLAFALTGTNTNRQWDIKVTQVECSNPSRPPNTCLQYMFGLTGRIETFNFANTNENHLASQDYSVCIRLESGFCCVQYQVCQDQIAAIAPQPGYSLDTSLATPAQDDGCLTTDYITIDQSADTCQSGTSTVVTSTGSRYCGDFFNFNAIAANGVICDCTAPFSVDIFTNAVSDMDAGIATITNGANMLSHGLCLEYSQVPCS